MRFPILAALLALTGCKGCNKNENDNNSPAAHSGEGESEITQNGLTFTISANLTIYGFDGDTIVVTGTQEDLSGAYFDMLDEDGEQVTVKNADGEKIEKTVGHAANLTKGEYTVLFDYIDEDGYSYLGEEDVEVVKDGDGIDAELCDDLSGDWSIISDSGSTQFDTENAEMDGCSVTLNGMGDLDVTSNHAHSEDEYNNSVDLVHNHDTDTLRILKVTDGNSVWFTGTRKTD